METKRLETLKQLADGVAAQFGSNCEVVIHEVNSSRMDHSIVYIVNGHVTERLATERLRWCWSRCSTMMPGLGIIWAI